jgi:hypothetical protein
MRYDALPHHDHVCRQIGFRHLVLDEADHVVGISYTGFELGPNDDDLSVTWLEYFCGSWEEMVRAAFAATCRTRVPGRKGVLAWANVGSIIEDCAKARRKVRVIHDPIDGNDAHALITQLPRDDIALLDLLATETFSAFFLNSFFISRHPTP